MPEPQPVATQQPGRLTAAARRALDSLNDLIHDSTDPGTEALAARHELEQALLNGQQPPADIDPATVATLLADQRAYERRLREQHDHDVAELNRLRVELGRVETAMRQIRHLHTDSPMGPCPVCIDADAVVAGGDGLMPYPCPTGRLAGAEDCDPPRLRAAVARPAATTVHACPPDGSGLTPCCQRTPFELPTTDQMTSDPAAVTCRPAATTQDGTL